MSDFFSVQMNIPDIPNVQVEQSGSSSVENPSQTTNNSFHSIFQQALPKDTLDTLSVNPLATQEVASELTDPNGATDKTASSIDQSLLLSGYINLKINGAAEKTSTSIDLPLIPSGDSDLKTNGVADKTATLIDQPLLPSGDIDPKTNGVAEKTVSSIEQSLLPSADSDLKANILQLFAYITNKINQETTTPNEPTAIDLDDNKLIELLNTYFESSSTKEIHQTLKDIRTALAQVNNPLPSASQENQSLGSFTTPDTQDKLTFGALTKNLGELQNLLTGKAGPDLPIASHTPIQFPPQQQALLERIQSFITNGQEAGTLSVKNIQLPENAASLHSRLTQLTTQIQAIHVDNNSTETSPLIKGDGFTALEEGLFAPTLRNRQQNLSGVRHDSTQQFYDAKTQAPNVINDSTNLADNQKSDNTNQPGSGFNQMGSPTTSPENSSTFSMANSNSLNPLTGQVTDPTKATMLPSGTVVQDQEVIQQLVERFKVNRRQQNSKIQIKLHPVELGKMEIDLTVKEGSIRANVVAQSQHVQEILERNIAKLRSVLEQQGFNVEDITVTSGSETVGEFDLFEQQLPHRDTSNSLAKNNKNETHTPFSIDDTEASDNEVNSGVNVKA
ncbi:MAG: flagellar hook-length control protein FliK [Desulforhopalus sp.]|jgi:flagellar hook-length control protein FliK